jgi:hypothetical protein
MRARLIGSLIFVRIKLFGELLGSSPIRGKDDERNLCQSEECA